MCWQISAIVILRPCQAGEEQLLRRRRRANLKKIPVRKFKHGKPFCTFRYHILYMRYTRVVLNQNESKVLSFRIWQIPVISLLYTKLCVYEISHYMIDMQPDGQKKIAHVLCIICE